MICGKKTCGTQEIIKKIKDSSELELIGNKTGGKISVEGYDMQIVIK